MNLAKLLEIDGHPTLIIYPKTHGSHPHTDIEGFTNRETGQCTTVRYEDELMPKPGTDTFLWLTNKVQEMLGVPIKSREWDGGIDIVRVYSPGVSRQPATSAA